MMMIFLSIFGGAAWALYRSFADLLCQIPTGNDDFDIALPPGDAAVRVALVADDAARQHKKMALPIHATRAAVDPFCSPPQVAVFNMENKNE